MQRQLRWLGYVIRMPSYRLPRRLLYGALQQGQIHFAYPQRDGQVELTWAL